MSIRNIFNQSEYYAPISSSMWSSVVSGGCTGCTGDNVGLWSTFPAIQPITSSTNLLTLEDTSININAKESGVIDLFVGGGDTAIGGQIYIDNNLVNIITNDGSNTYTFSDGDFYLPSQAGNIHLGSNGSIIASSLNPINISTNNNTWSFSDNGESNPSIDLPNNGNITTTNDTKDVIINSNNNIILNTSGTGYILLNNGIQSSQITCTNNLSLQGTITDAINDSVGTTNQYLSSNGLSGVEWKDLPPSSLTILTGDDSIGITGITGGYNISLNPSNIYTAGIQDTNNNQIFMNAGGIGFVSNGYVMDYFANNGDLQLASESSLISYDVIATNNVQSSSFSTGTDISIASAGSTGISINTNTDVSTKTFLFDTNGNIILPSNSNDRNNVYIQTPNNNDTCSIDMFTNWYPDTNVYGGEVYLDNTGVLLSSNSGNNIVKLDNDGLLSITGSINCAGQLTLGNNIYPNVAGNQNQLLTASGIGGSNDYVNPNEVLESLDGTITITHDESNGKANIQANISNLMNYFVSEGGTIDVVTGTEEEVTDIVLDSKCSYETNMINVGNSQGGRGGGSICTKTNFGLINTETFDLSTFNLLAYGFSCSCFDGKYVYYVPNNNTNTTVDGNLIRYDTHSPFNNSTSYNLFDLTTVNSACKGFSFCCVASPYIFFVTADLQESPTEVYNSIIVRYDTRLPFNSISSYAYYDLTNVDSNLVNLKGIIYNGNKNIYICSTNIDNGNSYLITYDINLPFNTSTSYNFLEFSTNTYQYEALVYDGKFIYMIPFSGSVIFRYDSSLLLQDDSVISYNISSVNALCVNYTYGTFDGRYIYLSPRSTGYAVKYDSTKDFQNVTNYSTFLLDDLTYSSVLFDGRYVYFCPLYLVGSTPDGSLTYYDITKSFSDVNSYVTINLQLVNDALAGLGTMACDGRYIYILPSYYLSEVGITDYISCRIPCYKGVNLGSYQLFL